MRELLIGKIRRDKKKKIKAEGKITMITETFTIHYNSKIYLWLSKKTFDRVS